MEFKRRLQRTKKNTIFYKGGLEMIRLTVFKQGTKYKPINVFTELRK